MTNPYVLPPGNVQIAFSGGRTSAYMLHRILEANGSLPERAVVSFQNTGREMPQTLDFVQEVASRWEVRVVWLEYRASNPMTANARKHSKGENMSFEFKPAVREAAPVFIGIEGESGSGKTYSALLLARGIVGPHGKIGVIDTEGKRSLMYADDPDIGGFLHMDFVAPYSSDRFRQAVHAARQAGVDAIVIDSASHEHEAEGGMLDYADQEEARGVKPRAKWIKPKMAHNRFIRSALSCGAHIIFCIRVKTIVDTDVKPAVKVKFPVCESNLPYEFTLRLRVENEGIAYFEKVPKPFQQHIRNGERVTVEHGALLMQEAGRGVDTSKVTRIISNLEEAASSGMAVFREAWKAAWRNNGPEEPKVITPERAELNKHLERLKRLAADADAAGAGDDDGGEREPDDIGKVENREAKKDVTRENAFDDDTFPGDRP